MNMRNKTKRPTRHESTMCHFLRVLRNEMSFVYLFVSLRSKHTSKSCCLCLEVCFDVHGTGWCVGASGDARVSCVGAEALPLMAGNGSNTHTTWSLPRPARSIGTFRVYCGFYRSCIILHVFFFPST